MKSSYLIIVILGIIISSCSKTEFTVEPTVVSVNEVFGKWKLMRYENLVTQENIEQPEIKKFGQMTVIFAADGTASGQFNCNTHFNTFSIVGGQLSLIRGGQTKVGCDESWSDNFYKVLDNSDKSAFISVKGAVLTIISTNHKRKVTLNKL